MQKSKITTSQNNNKSFISTAHSFHLVYTIFSIDTSVLPKKNIFFCVFHFTILGGTMVKIQFFTITWSSKRANNELAHSPGFCVAILLGFYKYFTLFIAFFNKKLTEQQTILQINYIYRKFSMTWSWLQLSVLWVSSMCCIRENSCFLGSGWKVAERDESCYWRDTLKMKMI